MFRRLLPLFVLLGCSSTQGTPPSKTRPAPSEQDPASPLGQTLDPLDVSVGDLIAAGDGINAFAVDVYGELAKTPGNVVFSPASIAIALGMTYQGATGETSEEFAKVLRLERTKLAPEQWHAAMGELGARWSSHANTEERRNPAPEIQLANRLFGAEGLDFQQSFLGLSLRDYRAPLERLDFGASEAARKHINDWVEDRTHDRIKDLLPPASISGGTLLVLANAIYFKAQWTHPFKKRDTKTAPFYVDGTAKTNVPMMQTTTHFNYLRDPVRTLVEMPYGNGQYSMVLEIPNERDGLSEVEKAPLAFDYGATVWTQHQVQLSMPKFKVEPSRSLALSSTLTALGLTRAFTGEAQFDGMVAKREPLQIDEVFHKAFVEVDEKGTEAAAATAVAMLRGGTVAREPIEVTVDRPFLFFICDTQTGAILFMGRVVDPR